MTKNTVFRVTGIPEGATLDHLKDAFSSTFRGEGVTLNTTETTICPSCYSKNRQTALVQFRPHPPRALDALPNGDSYQIRFNKDNPRQLITIDKDFYGLTQLYPTGKEIKADIVAVSGLNGHAYGSWRGRGELQSMWLRDFISEDFPSCRTMIFGYNSKLTSSAIHTTLDYTKSFLEELSKARQLEQEKNRPIIFIGHSFGGIIIAQSLVRAKENSYLHGPLFQSTRATIFFGTPHRGLLVDDILLMLGEGSPREDLVKSINNGSGLLNSELNRFIECSTNFKIVSFHETGQTRKLKQDENGRWSRSGDFFTSVEQQSSVLQLPSNIEENLPAEGDHSEMVKFKHNGHPSYTSVVRHLRNFTLDTGTGTEAGARYATAYSAVVNGSLDGLKRILQRTPRVVNERQSKDTTTLLHLAASAGHVGIAEMLLENGAYIGAEDEGENTALHSAAASGHEGVVRVLLENGAVIDGVNEDKKTALHIAAQYGYERVVELLLMSGAATTKDKSKRAPLHLAAAFGHEQVVKVLLAHGANIEEENSYGATALHMTATYGQPRVAEVLLDNGAKVMARDGDEDTALHATAIYGHAEVAEVLLRNRADIEAVNEDDRTALHLAAKNGKEGVAEVLLRYRADVEAVTVTTVNEFRALHLAAKYGHERVVEVLLKGGAYIGAFGEAWMTDYNALHLAAKYGHAGVVEVLLKNGADATETNGDGRTAKKLANKHGHKQVLEVLQRY